MTDPKKVIEELINRGIDWFDYKKHDDQNFWRTYFNEANSIANNEVFNNELHHYISDLVKFIAYESKDFDQVLHTRTAIVALETFKERLQSIENPDTKITSNLNPHGPI